MWVYGLDWAGPGQRQVADACECGNEPSDSVKCGEFLDQLQTSQLLKKDSAPWSKQDALISQIYFWNKTLRVSDSSSVHHQGVFTVHTAMVYVEFYSKNKFEKLVHLVSFIIRPYVNTQILGEGRR